MSHDQSTDNYIVVADTVNAKSYTVTDLTPGGTYRFKVEAHNAIGYGTPSAAFAVIASTNPDTPAAPSTVIDGDNVVISWDLSFNGGSPVNGYVVKLR